MFANSILWHGCLSKFADKQSLQFALNKILFKIFGYLSKNDRQELSDLFGVHSIDVVVAKRHENFVRKFSDADNFCVE